MCEHKRTLRVDAKCSDMCGVIFKDEAGKEKEHMGYVPSNLGIGSGDYVGFRVCVDCKILVNFPTLTDSDIRVALGDEEDDDELG